MAKPPRVPQARGSWRTTPKRPPAPRRAVVEREDTPEASAPPPAPRREREPIPPLLDRWSFTLFALVTIVYGSRGKNGFVYDDYPLIVGQIPPRSLRDLVDVVTQPHWNNLPYYRPLSRLILALEQMAFHERPGPYHLFNAALMGVVALLARALFSVPDLGVRGAIAFAGAALLTLHPVASEAVFPASVGPETLACFAAVLGAMVAWVRPGPRAHATAVVLMAAALLFKEQAVALPLLFVLADVCDLSYDAPGEDSDRWFARYVPVGVTALAWIGVRTMMLAAAPDPTIIVVDEPAGPILSALYTLESTLLPTWRLVYEPPVAGWSSPIRALACAALLTVFASVARRSWGELRRPTMFWAGWFVLALLPTANILKQETRFAERYALLCLPAVVGLACAVASTVREPASRRRFALGAVVAVAALAALTSLHRSTYYKSNRAFLEQWRATDPRPSRALASLGEESHRQGDDEAAVRYYREALALGPHEAEFAHLPLGIALEAMGNTDEAQVEYRAAQRAYPHDPAVRTHLASLLEAGGDSDGAEAEYRQQLQANPNDASALLNLGVLAANSGHIDRAIERYQEALRREPSWVADRSEHVRMRSKCHYNMARAYAEGGSAREAIAEYRASITEDPTYAFAHTNLALLLERSSRAEAIEHLRTALRYQPDLAIARTNLDRILGAADAGR